MLSLHYTYSYTISITFSPDIINLAKHYEEEKHSKQDENIII
jgi:hypothetical protein